MKVGLAGLRGARLEHVLGRVQERPEGTVPELGSTLWETAPSVISACAVGTWASLNDQPTGTTSYELPPMNYPTMDGTTSYGMTSHGIISYATTSCRTTSYGTTSYGIISFRMAAYGVIFSGSIPY